MRLVVVAVVALACASCHRFPGMHARYSDCHERAQPGTATGPVAIPEADAAFAQLRAYRNYYAIADVGAYEHHFAVWFTCVEQSVSYYAIAEDGSVRDAGGAWGGLAVRGDDVPTIPAEQQARANQIAAQHDADYVGASTGRVEYLGSYREVRVTERVPADGPADPYRRMMRHTTITLRGNADLTAFDGLAGLEGGETFLCWKDLAYGDCGPQRWFAFTPTRGVGEPQLAALLAPRSPQPDDERARFADAVLAAARAAAAGDPATPIDEILAGQSATPLPSGFAPSVVVGFTIYGRVKEGDQPSGAISVELSPVALLAGSANGHGEVEVGGVTFAVDLAMTASNVLSDEDGVEEADVLLSYVLADGRGHREEAAWPGHLRARVAADAAVITELTFTEPSLGMHTFPGGGAITSFDAYPGVSPRRDTWYPGSI